MKEQDQVQQITEQLKCSNCGAVLTYKPGSNSVVCKYCDTENPIESVDEEIVEELDFWKSLNNIAQSEDVVDVVSVKCKACAAITTLDINVTSDQCPFCGSNLILDQKTQEGIIRPKSVLPFAINIKEARLAFRNWIKKLWFAPNNLKRNIHSIEKLVGVYIPYWTYDSDTNSSYSGARGDYYYETVQYTATENGKTVSKTKQVRKIRWTPKSGRIAHFFDDVLIPASKSLPEKHLNKLEPWDLDNLKPFMNEYLSGFKAEKYQIGLEEGFGNAKLVMNRKIRSLVKRDIGGDQQRIHNIKTHYDNITFKHMLLPLYISAYQYRNKVYRFLINARTGEVSGERPYSFWKIFFAVLAALIIIAGVIFLVNYFKE